MQIALSTLLDVTSARTQIAIDPTAIARRVTTDSRDVRPGDIFVALRGERFDGHGFVETAIAQGAIVAIVDRATESSQPLPQLVVENTLAAYQAIARWWRDELGTTVIGITGSVGKTTTKELLAAVLDRYGSVLKTQKNYNNEIGVPKTLLELTPEHDYAVIEMAMRGTGQIAELARVAQPDVGVIVNVGTAHIGLLGSREAIAQAKCELLAELPKTSTAILNADNALLMATAATVWSGRQISYGFEAGDLRGDLDGEAETLHVGDRAFPLPLPGRHNASNYLAAIAVAESLGLETAGLTDGLTIALPDGRAKRIELANDIVLLDETYNAGLESMLAAIDLLAETPGKRRLAVLGTMKELGDRAVEFHRQVGEALAKRAAAGQFDALFVVAEPEAAAAIEAGLGEADIPCMTVTEETDDARASVTTKLMSMLQPGDRILLKASHSVALDRIVAVLCDRLRKTV